ncbi:MAG: YlxM family DNA-binding protein [Bacillota bacterium]|nr:YlxM family DNA-binding protein [Bacillota bacterium]
MIVLVRHRESGETGTLRLFGVDMMKIDEITRQSLLYDFYGALLTDRQREVMELYHEENLSLAEIAAEMEISRQGVHDALKKAEKALDGYEQKLGLVDKFQQTSRSIQEIDRRIDDIIGGPEVTGKLAGELKEIKSIIDDIDN